MSFTKSKDVQPATVDIVALAMAHQDEKGCLTTANQIKAESKGPIYEAAGDIPGLIRQINPDGSVALGTFSSGAFHPT